MIANIYNDTSGGEQTKRSQLVTLQGITKASA